MFIVNTKQLKNNLKECTREDKRMRIKEEISNLDEDADLIFLADATDKIYEIDQYDEFNGCKFYSPIDIICVLSECYCYIPKLVIVYLREKLYSGEINYKEAFIKMDNIYNKYGTDLNTFDSIILDKVDDELYLTIANASVDPDPIAAYLTRLDLYLSCDEWYDYTSKLASKIGEIIDSLL